MHQRLRVAVVSVRDRTLVTNGLHEEAERARAVRAPRNVAALVVAKLERALHLQSELLDETARPVDVTEYL